MHVELMQCFAREIVNDRMREAETARAIKNLTRSQREDGSDGTSRFRRALTRRGSVPVAGVAQR